MGRARRCAQSGHVRRRPESEPAPEALSPVRARGYVPAQGTAKARRWRLSRRSTPTRSLFETAGSAHRTAVSRPLHPVYGHTGLMTAVAPAGAHPTPARSPQRKDDTMTDQDLFPTGTAGLTEVATSQLIRLADGDRYALSISPVRKELGGDLRMLA